MNPGYLSLILICITLILLSSGWKNELVGDVSERAMIFFLVAWIPLAFMYIPFGDNYRLHLGYCMLLAVVITFLLNCRSVYQAVHMLSVGMLLGVLYFLLQQLLRLDPLMVIVHPQLDMALTMGLLALLMFHLPLGQIVGISSGILLGDLWFHWIHRSTILFELGGASFQDQWWLTMAATRLLSMAYVTLKKLKH